MPPGLKLNNKNSAFKKDEETKESFEEKIRNNEHKQLDFNSRAYKLGSKFIESITDRTLPENRSTVTRNLEKELISEIQKLSLEMNDSKSNQPEGMGSVIVEALMLSSFLKFRDRLNDIDFRLAKLEKSQSELK